MGLRRRSRSGPQRTEHAIAESRVSTYGQPVRGFLAFGIFLLFGSAMALLAAATLLFPGTILDRAWVLNPRGHQQLALIGRPAGVFFLLLCALLLSGGIGWFRKRRWAWWLAIFVIALQLAGNIGSMAAGQVARGVFGATIAAILLIYLLRVAPQAFAPRQTAPQS